MRQEDAGEVAVSGWAAIVVGFLLRPLARPVFRYLAWRYGDEEEQIMGAYRDRRGETPDAGASPAASTTTTPFERFGKWPC